MSNIKYTVYSRTLTLCMSGESVDEKGHSCEPDQYGTFDTVDAAIAEAREIAAAPDAVKLIDQRGHGIGAIDHLLVYVDAFLHDEETDDIIPCDAEGRTDDPYGPDSIIATTRSTTTLGSKPRGTKRCAPSGITSITRPTTITPSAPSLKMTARMP